MVLTAGLYYLAFIEMKRKQLVEARDHASQCLRLHQQIYPRKHGKIVAGMEVDRYTPSTDGLSCQHVCVCLLQHKSCSMKLKANSRHQYLLQAMNSQQQQCNSYQSTPDACDSDFSRGSIF